MTSEKKKTNKSLIIFLSPVLLSLTLFAFLNPACQVAGEKATGVLTLLYTSEVGGRLDPCG